MTSFSIEIDCAPFSGPRPGDLLPAVIAGTPLEGKLVPDQPASALFGNWVWPFELTDEEYAAFRDTIKARITALYHSGSIRYGSW
jgi:hypothetical protein